MDEPVETPEQRAARKAAKKAKKEAKRAKKEEKKRREAEEAATTKAKGGAGGDSDPGSSSEEEDAPSIKTSKAASAAQLAGHKRKRSDSVEESHSKHAAAPAPALRTEHKAQGGAGEPRKNFYKPSPALAAVSQERIAAFRAEKQMAVEDPFGDAATWTPIMEFSQVGDNFSREIMKATATFKTPSPIQAQSWPVVLSGRDMIGLAATGSGKTLAFTLPGLVHINAQPPLSKSAPGPLMLVLSPTRELAMQSAAVAETCGAHCNVRSTCIYGGVSKREQVDILNRQGGVHIVVATPGRLLDLMQEGAVNLSRVSLLVLDEADRMLDMGFEKEVRAIVTACNMKGRQTVMFSATWPPAIQNIANEYLRQPVKVMIGNAELAASHTVTQIVEVVDGKAKDATLQKLLQKYHSSRANRVLVFALYKKEAARVEESLQRRGWSCVAIHGDMSQDARTKAFHSFRDGKVPLLVATDVAARGLDIPDVEVVINLTFPLTIEDYVHRIGRTGRAGKSGIAHTLFTQDEKHLAGALVNVLREAGQEVPDSLMKFGTHVKKKEHSLYGAHFKDSGAGGGSGAAAVPTRMKFDD